MSPMGILWSFMGASRSHTIFGGWLELIPAVLLVFRRTAMLGALLASAVLTNIVMLNFSYDVPVKLFSLELLAYAIAIALPQAFRLLIAAIGYSVAAVPTPVRMPPSWERARRYLKLTMVGSMAVGLFAYAAASRHRHRPAAVLHGIWSVESFAADGHELAPLRGRRRDPRLHPPR